MSQLRMGWITESGILNGLLSEIEESGGNQAIGDAINEGVSKGFDLEYVFGVTAVMLAVYVTVLTIAVTIDSAVVASNGAKSKRQLASTGALDTFIKKLKKWEKKESKRSKSGKNRESKGFNDVESKN